MTKKPKKILHIVGGMNRGGVETWLMHVLRHIDRTQYQIDFLVHTTEKCAYDDEIIALGSKIIPCLHPSKPLMYARNLRQILQVGSYDIVHSHVHHYSGWIMTIARHAGVPIRIAQSHSDTSRHEANASFKRRVYLFLMKQLIQHNATHGLSISRLAAGALFGADWESQSKHHLLYYGIDLTSFERDIDVFALRTSLNIPDDAFVIGLVGRFVEVKNHTFLIDIFKIIAEHEPKALLLFIGDGELRSQIEAKARLLGLEERVIFGGLRGDVPDMMRIMDVFVMPSLYEGLGIVLIEAQAAGLPCIYTDVIPEEAEIIPQLVLKLSLKQPAEAWAETILSVKSQPQPLSQMEALQCVGQSRFNIEQSTRDLMLIYDR